MTDAIETACAIHREITRLRALGEHVEVVTIAPMTQAALADANIGTWRAGPRSYSIFNIPVVVEQVKGGWVVRGREE